MKILLDTHAFLWFISADPKLPPRTRFAIQDGANEVFLNAASVWEAVIKSQLGKLPLPAPPQIYFPQRREVYGFTSLVIDEGSLACLAALPTIHRDPFDRMLAAQAIQHDLLLATMDPILQSYPVSIRPID